MKSATSDEIIEGIKKIENCYLNDILNTILERLRNNKDYIIDCEEDGYYWKIECINPYGELDPEKIL